MRIWLTALALAFLVACGDDPETKKTEQTDERKDKGLKESGIKEPEEKNLKMEKPKEVINTDSKKKKEFGKAGDSKVGSSFQCPKDGCKYTTAREGETCFDHPDTTVVPQ